MAAFDLETIYRAYIKDISNGKLENMSLYVGDHVVHNNIELGLTGYVQLLKDNIVSTQVSIEIKRLIADQTGVAAILVFTTKASTKSLVGIELDDVPFSFEENVVYDFEDGKIVKVHSLYDVDAVRSHRRQS